MAGILLLWLEGCASVEIQFQAALVYDKYHPVVQRAMIKDHSSIALYSITVLVLRNTSAKSSSAIRSAAVSLLGVRAGC